MSYTCPQEGIIAALAIPTDTEGQPIKAAVCRHLTWLRSSGIHGVLGLGSTGEFLFFSPEERKRILELLATAAAPLPVVANVSDLRPQAAADLARFARRLGLPAVAVMSPHFYPVSDVDQLAFFTYVAEAAQLPVLLYNFPERAGNRISLETIAAFAERAPLAGIKQSGAEFCYHEDLIALGREKGFPVFTGADTRLPEAFALGASGCIGGLVNFVPEEMVALFHRCRKGQPGDRTTPAARLEEVGWWMDRLTFPRNIAAGIEARGLEPGHPKAIVAPSSQSLYEEVVSRLRARFEEWNLPPAPGRSHA